MSQNSATSDRVHTVAERIKILGLKKFAEELRKKREVESILSILKLLPNDSNEALRSAVLTKISQWLKEYRVVNAGDLQLDYLMGDYYYTFVNKNNDKKSYLLAEEIGCNFCGEHLDKKKDGQYRTIKEVRELSGACVDCQCKLLEKVKKCNHRQNTLGKYGSERSYSQASMMGRECEYCYDRGLIDHCLYHLRCICGVKKDQIDLVIRAFNRARELNMFKETLTFASVTEDLNSMKDRADFYAKYCLSEL
jgi:hypothetical protein